MPLYASDIMFIIGHFFVRCISQGISTTTCSRWASHQLETDPTLFTLVVDLQGECPVRHDQGCTLIPEQ